MKLAPLLALLAVSVSHPSWAVTLPDAYTDQYLQYGVLQRIDTDITGPSSLTLASGTVATYDNAYAPNPSMSASLSTKGLGPKEANEAGSGIYYSFEVVDATSSAASPVDLSVNYSWGASASGSPTDQFSASIAMLILNPADSSIPLLLQPCLSNYAPQCTAGQSYHMSGTASASVLTNTVYNFDIAAGVTSYGVQTVSAYLDPYLYLTQANPNLQIEVSDGVGNLAAVPEPSSTILMLAGLAALGVRRLRKSAAA